MTAGALTERERTASSRPDGRDPGSNVSPVRRLQHVFEATADRTPNAVAVESDGTTLTYADLDMRANQLAHHLRDRGIGGGARVAILLHRSFETYVALLGVGKAGAVFVPIDPASPPDRIAYHRRRR